MAIKLSLWERVLRLVLPEKTYVLRSIQKQQLAIETNVDKFGSDVDAVEVAIADTVLLLRTLQLRQVESEDRLTHLNIKIEGATADFQNLQNKKKHEDAAKISDTLTELIDEQIGIEKSVAKNNESIKNQNAKIKQLRRNLSELKELLRDANDKKDDLNARYSAVQAMSKAQATLQLLESHDHTNSVNSLETTIRKKEIDVSSKAEVRGLGEDQEFARLERFIAVEDRVNQLTTSQKGI